MKRPAAQYTVSVSYSCITPESAEFGDFSDVGLEKTEQTLTIREVIDCLESYGCYMEAKRELDPQWTNASIYSPDSTITNYRTGEETSYCVHIKASSRNMRRLLQALGGAPAPSLPANVIQLRRTV